MIWLIWLDMIHIWYGRIDPEYGLPVYSQLTLGFDRFCLDKWRGSESRPQYIMNRWETSIIIRRERSKEQKLEDNDIQKRHSRKFSPHRGGSVTQNIVSSFLPSFSPCGKWGFHIKCSAVAGRMHGFDNIFVLGGWSMSCPSIFSWVCMVWYGCMYCIVGVMFCSGIVYSVINAHGKMVLFRVALKLAGQPFTSWILYWLDWDRRHSSAPAAPTWMSSTTRHVNPSILWSNAS